MARNMTTEMTEKHRATKDEMAKMLKAGSFSKVGAPTPLLSDLTPPGTVAKVGNATAAMSPATTEHDCEVLASHLPPRSTSSSWVLLNISLGVSLALLYIGKK